MKHPYALPILFLFPVIGAAQSPVLDFYTNGTVPGDAFTYQQGPWLAPGTTGADQTWDFSGLTSTGPIQIQFVEPSSTPSTLNFPTATIAAEDNGSFAYSQFNTSGGQFLGTALQGSGILVYSDPMQMVVFPISMGTTWTDGFNAEGDQGGVYVVRVGSITGTCDGYGTLDLPWGSLTDVLRTSYTEDYTDEYDLYSAVIHREYTYFTQAGTHYPIVNIYTTTSTVLGNTLTYNGTQWMSELPTGTRSAVANSTDLSAMMDPATSSILVNMRLQTSAPATIELLNAAGVVVERHTLGTLSAGQRSERVGTNGLAGGLYLVRLRAGDVTATCRVVLQ